MSFTRRLTQKHGRTESVQALADSRLIGLHVDSNFEYDPVARQRANYRGSPPPEKIRNFVVFAPTGPTYAKHFLHGKDILTEENAAKFFENPHTSAHLLNDDAVERVANALRPASFDARAAGYAKKAASNDFAGQLIESLADLKEEYPHIDLSTVPKLNGDNQMEFLQAIMQAMEKAGIDLGKMVAEVSSPSSETILKSVNKAKAKLKETMPSVLEEYFAAPDGRHLKARYETELRDFLKAHDYDPEIVENFKAGIGSGAQTSEALDAVLEHGVRQRARTALHELCTSGTFQNPYSEPFTTTEKGMARVLTDSVSPRVLRTIREKRTPFILCGDDTIQGLSDSILTMPAQGQYRPATPASPYFSDFLMVADDKLQHDNLSWLARHESEHFLDLNARQNFERLHGGKIPEASEQDVKKISSAQEFLENLKSRVDSIRRQVYDQSEAFCTANPEFYKTNRQSLEKQWFEQGNSRILNEHAEDIHRLQVMLKKRGAPREIIQDAGKGYDITGTCEHLLYEIKSKIMPRLAVFSGVFGQGEEFYNTKASQFAEVPAIIEELKGKHGRTFIAELLPNLSRLCEQHRAEILRL